MENSPKIVRSDMELPISDCVYIYLYASLFAVPAIKIPILHCGRVKFNAILFFRLTYPCGRAGLCVYHFIGFCG